MRSSWIPFVVGLLLLAGCTRPADDAASNGPAVGTTVEDDGAAGVTVKATLVSFSSGQAMFNVTLDTHSVDLTDYDPSEHSALEDSAGQHEPKAGSRVTVPGSHHKETDLVFDAGAGRLVLVIKDLGGVPERRLSFD